MLGTEPKHVLSTSLLCNSLLYDKRFRRVPMTEAVPGDIIVASSGNRAEGYAGIVVGHGRIVSNGNQGVQNNSSLAEIRRSQPTTVIFRYIGVQGHRTYPLANAGYNPDEARLPAGEPGGGQWTAGGAGGAQNGTGLAEMAPSTTVLSGGNQSRPGDKTSDVPALDALRDYLGAVAEVWKGYGDAITATVSGLWNAARHPINTAKAAAQAVTNIVKDPVGTLKAIGRQIAHAFTNGDPRKAGKLVGQALIASAGTEVSAEKLASLLPKVEAAAAGEEVSLTGEEAEILQRVMSGEAKRGGVSPVNKGKEGVEQSEAEAIAAGEKVKGKEVTFELPSGKRTRSDLLTENEERLKVREAKKGPTAKLSTAQTEMQRISSHGGTVIPRGPNAQAGGLKPGEPIKIPQHEVDHHQYGAYNL